MPPKDYVLLLSNEIQVRSADVPFKLVDTIYFGGGTPSLFKPALILAILDELAKAGFQLRENAEITLEIDPATVDQNTLNEFINLGINRFSVGAQTFNSRLLQIAGRKHTSSQTIELLSLLKKLRVNYSFDLLFALPTQTRDELRLDVATALQFDPDHLSAYCLTVPEHHPMARGRAPDSEQAEMFQIIDEDLSAAGVLRYEISNYAKPGKESRHNLLYWTDQAYWGIGTGAHSYFPTLGNWGARFSNPPSLGLYEKELRRENGDTAWHFERDVGPSFMDLLNREESLSDFCHTSLRLTRGVSKEALRLKFGVPAEQQVTDVMSELISRKLIELSPIGWRLSTSGRMLANVVFEKLTFSS